MGGDGSGHLVDAAVSCFLKVSRLAYQANYTPDLLKTSLCGVRNASASMVSPIIGVVGPNSDTKFTISSR